MRKSRLRAGNALHYPPSKTSPGCMCYRMSGKPNTATRWAVFRDDELYTEPPDGFSIVLWDSKEILFETKVAADGYIAEGVCGGTHGPPGKPAITHRKCGAGKCEFRSKQINITWENAYVRIRSEGPKGRSVRRSSKGRRT